MDLIEHAEGIVVTVRVQPGAKRSAILGEYAGGLKIAVAAPPVDGKANEAIVEFFRELTGLKRSQIDVIRGEKSRNKLVLLRSISRADVERLLGLPLSDL